MPRDRRPGPNRPASARGKRGAAKTTGTLTQDAKAMQPAHPFAPRATERRPAARAGFTLTELLVVISIIAVLASLGTYGAMRRSTRPSRRASRPKSIKSTWR